MTSLPDTLTNITVLIVDPSGTSAFDMRQSFMKNGAATHVVGALAAAERVLKIKKISAVVLPYSAAPETVNFCRKLADQNIRSVFTCDPLQQHTGKSGSEAFHVSNTPMAAPA